MVSADGVATDINKVAAIHKRKAPKDAKALQTFLRTAVYYRQYLPDFTTIANPGSSVEITRGSEAQRNRLPFKG